MKRRTIGDNLFILFLLMLPAWGFGEWMDSFGAGMWMYFVFMLFDRFQVELKLFRPKDEEAR